MRLARCVFCAELPGSRVDGVVGGEGAVPGKGDRGALIVRGDGFAQRGVRAEAEEVLREFGIVGGEQAFRFVGDELAHAAGAHGDNRQAGGAGFEGGDTEGFEDRRQNEDVALGEQGFDVSGGERAAEAHVVGDAEAAGEKFESTALGAVTGDLEADAGVGGKLSAGGAERAKESCAAFAGGEAHHAGEVDDVWRRMERELPLSGDEGVRQHVDGDGAKEGTQVARDALAHCGERDGPARPAEGGVEGIEHPREPTPDRMHGEHGWQTGFLREVGRDVSGRRNQAAVRVDDVEVARAQHRAETAESGGRPREADFREQPRRHALDPNATGRFGGTARRRDDGDLVAGGDEVGGELAEVALDAAGPRQIPVANEGDAQPAENGSGQGGVQAGIVD